MTMDVSESKLGDGFTAGAFQSVLPMVIWATHFFVSYASAEVACALDLNRFALLGVAAPSVWLWMISAAAIVTLLALTVRAVQAGRTGAESRSTAATVRIGAAILALVGVLWSAVPIALVYGPTICHAPG